jgi:hypothetical protein
MAYRHRLSLKVQYYVPSGQLGMPDSNFLLWSILPSVKQKRLTSAGTSRNGKFKSELTGRLDSIRFKTQQTIADIVMCIEKKNEQRTL